MASVRDSRPSWVPADLYPFASHFEDINGSRVHYLDEGAGPPLILLHGNPTWSFLYRDVIAGLRDRYRCIAVDYPGFGLSRAAPGYGYTPAEHAQAVEDLIVRLDLRGATLMMQDWGGPIGFAVATRHPDRFSAFVLGNTWAWPKAISVHHGMFSRLQAVGSAAGDPATQLLRRTDHPCRRAAGNCPTGDDRLSRTRRRNPVGQCTCFRAKSLPAERFCRDREQAGGVATRPARWFGRKDFAFRAAEARRGAGVCRAPDRPAVGPATTSGGRRGHRRCDPRRRT